MQGGREHISLHNVIGYFADSVLLVTVVDPEEDFIEFLERVEGNVLKALDYQAYPVELVLEELKIPYPELTVAFNMLTMFEEEIKMDQKPYKPFHIKKKEANFDLEPCLTEYNNGIVIHWKYDRKVFPRERIEDVSNTYIQILAEISQIGQENK